jgi:hypothetical protein
MMFDELLGHKPREQVSEAALEQVLSETARRMPNPPSTQVWGE